MNKLFILLFFSTSLFAQSSDDSINQIDANGLKQGKWVKYYAKNSVGGQATPEQTGSSTSNDRIKRYEGQFVDDKAVGKFIYYYETGETRSVLLHGENARTRAKNFYPNGTILATGVYVGELRDSTWTYYSIYGEKIAVEYYIVGKLYGNCKKFHPNGQLLEEKYFENGLENGVFKEYYDNGIIAREGTYVYGSLEGKSAFYHSNGVVRFEGVYMKDTKNGIWKTYDEQGELTDERMYVKGIPEYRDSDVIYEDSTKYYRKDYLDISDFDDEDYMAIPEKEKGKMKNKK